MGTPPTPDNVQAELDALLDRYPVLVDFTPTPTVVDVADLFLEHGVEVSVALDRLVALRATLAALLDPDQ